MSTTTTTQTQTKVRTRQDVLKDYELHHSASSSRAAPRNPGGLPERPQAAPLNPPGWDTTHRRVPPYRPTNRDPEHYAEVRVYTSTIEQVFIGTMFTGVFTNATAAKVWRASVGRFNDNMFKYAIGGEI
ncbi:hypothetical protein C8A05DRAFT_32052 [Staphylotrichum tortipilum]|uniref:Uncharacterized protein n=1 Tax=Staphylotrichum tortipilum TaxID=2831512 RepID=A0AAN6MNZ2_9PEZI|nr:hypothetical protein C8A05DRAFT_32052 [Staphylotrichum longicolle]